MNVQTPNRRVDARVSANVDGMMRNQTHTRMDGNPHPYIKPCLGCSYELKFPYNSKDTDHSYTMKARNLQPFSWK